MRSRVNHSISRVLSVQLDIIFQDQYLIAVNKPAGLLVHKSPIDKYETQNAMHILRDQLGQWVYPLHRLDKPTSGVLLFALDSDIAKTVSEQFEQHAMQKKYLAVVRGYIDQCGCIDKPIKPTADFKTDKKRYQQKAAQDAVTEYICKGQIELPYTVDKYPTSRYSLVELYPKTGRKHQLRKHLKYISHPIIGDARYGKSSHNHFFKTHFACQRLLLAAQSLLLQHPVTGDQVSIEAGLDRSFQKIVDQFI